MKKKLIPQEDIPQPLSESTVVKIRYVGDLAQKGWRAGCAFGAIAMPIAVMKYGRQASHANAVHHWMLTGLGKYALLGAVASALIGAYKVSVANEQQLVNRVNALGHDSRQKRIEIQTGIGAGVGAATAGLFARRAVMQGMIGGAALGTLAGLGFHAYDEFQRNGGKFDVVLPSFPKDFDHATNKLRKASDDVKKLAFEV